MTIFRELKKFELFTFADLKKFEFLTVAECGDIDDYHLVYMKGNRAIGIFGAMSNVFIMRCSYVWERYFTVKDDELVYKINNRLYLFRKFEIGLLQREHWYFTSLGITRRRTVV